MISTEHNGNGPLGIIFDMDGVLVDSYDAHHESWKLAAAEKGLSFGDEDFNRTFGRTSRDIIHLLWPGKFNDTEARAYDDRKEELYRQVIGEHFPEMDGAGDLIAELHKDGFRIAIGSSGMPENVNLVRRRLTNGKLISDAVTGAEVKRGKPDPQVFLLAAGKLGVEPARCAVVEDAPVGVEAARRAGMYAIGLLGTAPREKLALYAHVVVSSLRELKAAEIAAAIAQQPRT